MGPDLQCLYLADRDAVLQPSHVGVPVRDGHLVRMCFGPRRRQPLLGGVLPLRGEHGAADGVENSVQLVVHIRFCQRSLLEHLAEPEVGIRHVLHTREMLVEHLLVYLSLHGPPRPLGPFGGRFLLEQLIVAGAPKRLVGLHSLEVLFVTFWMFGWVTWSTVVVHPVDTASRLRTCSWSTLCSVSRAVRSLSQRNSAANHSRISCRRISCV